MIKKEFICQKQDKVLNIVSKNEISYSNANKLLRKKDIRVDNVKINENIVVYPGQKITVFMPEEFLMDEKKFFEIVYEDENILIINKQKGIEVTSPFENSIEKILLKEKKVFPLNRLDRNTEGLVIFGKTKDFFEKLKKAMKNGEIEKYYLLEVVGTPNFENKNVVSFLQKDEEKSEVKIFDSPRKDSVKIETNLSVVSRSSGGTSVLIAEIHNGKTHQIRAQLAHIGYPIVVMENMEKTQTTENLNRKHKN